MGFFEENWLWRGTQSAIFYYVSCSPCIEWKYKRKRRHEADRAKRQRSETVTTQPGRIAQPGAFQTNSDWIEEILMGPGPPKGWKRDPVAEKCNTNVDKLNSNAIAGCRNGCSNSHHIESQPSPVEQKEDAANGAPGAPETTPFPPLDEVEATRRTSEERHSESLAIRNSTDSSSTSSSSSSDTANPLARPRPSLERRISTAMDNIRDTLRSTMQSERWNWIRYERDDEILSGFNQRMSDMWYKATNFGTTDKNEQDNTGGYSGSSSHRQKRAETVSSDQFDYQKYTRHPEINDLHPPVVSRLPATRDAAAWMILPPPSAVVMEGKARPQDQLGPRWPLARIGRTAEDWKELRERSSMARTRSGSGRIESLPELSESVTDPSSSSGDEDAMSNGPIQRQPVDLTVRSKNHNDTVADFVDLTTSSATPERNAVVDT